MTQKELSIIFPCYNEKENLSAAVGRAVDFALSAGFEYEIIIVDDGSTDSTSDEAEALIKDNKNIKLFRHSSNKGYGAALKTGFANALKNLVFFTDADRQFDIFELNRLLPEIGKYDIAAGYRIKRQDPMIRIWNAALWNILVNLVFGFRFRDVNCAFKLFRKEALQAVLPLFSDGAFINAEIFSKSIKKGFSIVEVGVSHYPRLYGNQSGADPKVIFRAFFELLRYLRPVRR